MKNFLKMIFSQTTYTPPADVQQKLSDKFPDIINVEWNKSGNNFEAIFYKDQLEYIALFEQSGELLGYKMSITEDLLPLQIKENLTEKGEIMNAVLNNQGNGITYEVILRDSHLKRFVFVLNETGTILSEKKL
ncbi:MAG: hypothetical protein ACERKD_21040 [Prolixibacteraceae bacterium]